MELVNVINYSKICNLIYSQKTKNACALALDLLSEPAIGIDEALRYLYMRDACYRLGEKEKVIEYGHMAKQCAKEFFDDNNVLDINNLYNQRAAIKLKLQDIGICDIEMYINAETNTFRIDLCREKFCLNILISDLEKEIDSIIRNRIRDERYFYYREAADEIVKNIKEVVSPTLYGRIIVNTSRSV